MSSVLSQSLPVKQNAIGPLREPACKPKCYLLLCRARLQDSAISSSRSPPTEHHGVLHPPADRIFPSEPRQIIQ